MTERMDNVPRVGLARLRRAMENQMALGGGEFHLPFSDVEVILREAEEERGVLSSIPQNVGAEPEHYRGDGVVTCSRALRSMFEGWERAGYRVSGLAKYWAGVAFKYIWRFPLKDDPARDLEKAKDCVSRALGCDNRWDDGDYDEPGWVWVVDGRTGKDDSGDDSWCPLAVFARMEEADEYCRDLGAAGGEAVIVKLPVGEVVE